MFREMRRKKQALSKEKCEEILYNGKSGVLAVSGDDDYPYAVPLSYVYCDGRMFFHCAKTGHKLDAITKNEKASFCIIDKDEIMPHEYTTYFRSVILFGKAHIINDDKEKYNIITKLAKKYAPNESESGRKKAINAEWSPLCIVEFTIEHMSGKEAIELVNKKSPTK